MGALGFLRRKALPATSNTLLIQGVSAELNRSVDAYVQEGFCQNPIVYSVVTRLMKAVSNVKLEVHTDATDGKKVVTTHAVLELLAKPNPMQSWKAFVQEMVMWHRVAGEAFVLRLPAKGPAAELYLLDPRKVGVKARKEGLVPEAFTYGDGEDKKIYPVNPLTGESQVLQIKTANPQDPFRGLSPLSAAARPVDTHNSGWRWNANLLVNGARPSGYVEMTGTVDENALNRLRQFFKKAWSGWQNAGDIPMLTGGAKFTQLSHNPKDMDFANSMGSAAKDMSLVYGIPLPLVTMDAATFSNMDAAQEMLWSDTVLDLLDEIIKPLGDFLMPTPAKGKPRQYLAYNADSVPAFEGKRTRLYERMNKAAGGPVLTPNEARVEMGYDDIEGGDLLRNAPQDPDKQAEQAQQALKKALLRCGYDEERAEKAMAEEFNVRKVA